MTAQVISLAERRNAKPPNQDVVQVAKAILRQAEAGDIQGLMYVVDYGDARAKGIRGRCWTEPKDSIRECHHLIEALVVQVDRTSGSSAYMSL